MPVVVFRSICCLAWPRHRVQPSRTVTVWAVSCVWGYDTDCLLVQEVEASTLNRWGHTTTLYGDKLVVFGG